MIAGEVMQIYRGTNHTMKQIAVHLKIGLGSVHEIIKRSTTQEERRELKRRRLRDSKLGRLNPMAGKKPGNFVGKCDDGRGYVTEVVDGRRYFVHRIVMAEMIGIHPRDLPPCLEVHHIDENKRNNEPDNLMLVTPAGHRSAHYLMAWTSALREEVD
ncbi:HNH endonuclease [Erythrobacter litoralis]|nr:HNH endonuclease [Erythrobacter litoralis]